MKGPTVDTTIRTKLKRLPKRGSYDRDVINSILDEAIICHVGFVVDGQPYVIPTGYGRIGDQLYMHGSAASRMLRTMANGVDVCVTVTLLDALVMARSAFHHSVNYRSVVILGKAVLVDDPDEKMAALEAITDHFVPGRWKDTRLPNQLEMKATSVLRLPIAEASAKIRTGSPIDDDEDHDLNIWAGILPLTLTPGEPVDDELLRDGIEVPKNIRNYRRNGST